MGITTTTVSVGTTATAIVSHNTKRKRLVIQNKSTTDDVSLGADDVTDGEGEILNRAINTGEAGGSAVMVANGYDPSVALPWYGIVGTGTATVTVTEVT